MKPLLDSGRAWIAVALAMGVSMTSLDAWAQRVVVIRPGEDQPLLLEVFNRLQGELRMQGFQALPTNAMGPVDYAKLRPFADDTAAQACVAFEWKEGHPTIHLWYLDKQLDKEQSLSLSGTDDPDTAVVLPMRAVDLLRSASLRGQEESRHSPSSVPTTTVSTTTAKPTAAPKARDLERPRWLAGGMFGTQWATLKLYPSFDIGVKFAVRFGTRVWTGVEASWPVSESAAQGEHATARFKVAHMNAALAYRYPFLEERLWVESMLGVGASYVRATADVDESLRASSPWGWGANGFIGTGIGMRLGVRYFVTGQLRVGALVPRLVVAYSDRAMVLGRPFASTTVGGGVEF